MLLWRGIPVSLLMATCPRCKGHLTDSHRCPRGRLFGAAEVVLWAVAGGIAGFLLVALFDPHALITDDVYLTAAIAGILIAIGANRVLRS